MVCFILYSEFKEQFENFNLVFSILSGPAFDRYGKGGSTMQFGVLVCKRACAIDLQNVLVSVTEGKKKILKGKMKAQTAAALIILTRDVRMLK